jgi:hypothetical protein
MKPNGIVFLEVAFLSQFTSLALILEFLYFRRLWVMLLLGFGLLVSFAGTGLLLLLICSPFLIWRMPLKLLPAILIIGAVIALTAVKVGWYDQVHQRFTEYQASGSSAHNRFIEPAIILRDFLSDPQTVLTGLGPGSLGNGDGAWWPLVKCTYEYGIITGVLFCAFLGYCLFRNPPHVLFAFAMFIFYNFLGSGFAVPIYGFPLLMLSAIFSLAPARQPFPATANRRPQRLRSAQAA